MQSLCASRRQVWLLFLLAAIALVGGAGQVRAQSAATLQPLWCLAEEAARSAPAEGPPTDCLWGPEPGPLARGGATALWARLSLPESLARGGSHELRVGPHAVASVDLLLPADGGWQVQRAGQRADQAAGHTVLQGYRFAMTGPPAGPVAYLRFNAPLPEFAWVELRTSHAGVSLPAEWGLGLHTGLLLALFLLSLAGIWLEPGPVTRRFALLMGAVLLCVISGSGLLQILWFGDAWELDARSFQALVMFRLSIWLAVIQALLAPYRAPAWVRPLGWAIHGSTAAAAAFAALGVMAPAQLLTFLGPLLLPLPLLLALRQTQGIPRPLRLALAADMVVLQANIALVVLSVWWNPPGMNLPVLATRMTDLGTAVAMLALVIVRNRVSRRELEATRQSLVQTQLQAQYERRMHLERGKLSNMLNHELKNALAAVELAAHNLRPDLPADASGARRRLANIEASVRAMDQILARRVPPISASPDASSGADDGAWVRAIPVQVDAMLREVIQRQAAEGRVAWLGGSLPQVLSDPQLLSIIFSKLLGNALHYSPPGTAVRIEASVGSSEHEQRPCLRVGFSNVLAPGVMLEPDRVFEQRSRLESDLDPGGSGVGLYLVRKLAAFLGGSVCCELSKGEVRFSVEIPV